MQRFNPCEKVLNVHNVEGLSLKWSYTTGGGVVGAAAVANGVVYVGSNDHNQYALNASTGAPLWSYATGDVGTSPTVANGVVYVSPYSDWYSNLYALNASTGAELWSYSDRGFLSSPAVANGVVYVGTEVFNSLVALNASTGGLL
jgi:outer membrane protein assembly factor BamB